MDSLDSYFPNCAATFDHLFTMNGFLVRRGAGEWRVAKAEVVLTCLTRTG